jgi:hypothetical protein
MLGKINNLETLNSKFNNLEFDETLLNRLNLTDVEEDDRQGEEEKYENARHQGFGK